MNRTQSYMFRSFDCKRNYIIAVRIVSLIDRFPIYTRIYLHCTSDNIYRLRLKLIFSRL